MLTSEDISVTQCMDIFDVTSKLLFIDILFIVCSFLNEQNVMSDVLSKKCMNLACQPASLLNAPTAPVLVVKKKTTLNQNQVS